MIDGDFAAASEFVEGVNFREVYAEWVIAAVAHAVAGKTDAAAQAFERLIALREAPESFVEQVPVPPDVADLLLRGLALARQAHEGASATE